MARRGYPRISRRVRICGSKGCKTVRAIVDTGASVTSMTERLAKSIGVVPLSEGRMHTANGPVKVHGGAAKLCLNDKGCGCLTGPVAILPAKSFGDSELLVGQDYLEASRAIIDTAGRKLRCRLRRR